LTFAILLQINSRVSGLSTSNSQQIDLIAQQLQAIDAKSHEESVLLQRLDSDNRKSREQSRTEMKAIRDLTNHFSSDIKDIYALQQQQKVYIDNIVSSNTQYIHIQTQLSEQNLLLQTQQTHIQELINANQNLNSKIVSLEENLKQHMSESIESIQNNIETHNADLISSMSKCARKDEVDLAVTSRIVPIEQNIIKLNENLDNTSKSLITLDDRLTNCFKMADEKTSSIFEQIDDMMGQYADTVKTLSSNKQDMNDQIKQINDLHVQLSDLEKISQGMNGDITHMRSESKSDRDDIGQLSCTLKSIQIDNKEVYESLNVQLGKLEELGVSHSRDINELKAAGDSLGNDVRGYEVEMYSRIHSQDERYILNWSRELLGL